MGSLLSPVMTNIYMEYFEEMALGSTSLKPSLRLRYVDDTFMLWPHQEDQIQLDHVNSIQSSKLFFLDVLINSDRAKIQVICVSKAILHWTVPKLQYFQETTLGSTSLKPSLRLRYVDDTFTLWPQQEDVQTLLDQVNSIRPSIQFSREKEQDNRLSFLDVLINSDRAKIQVICVSKAILHWTVPKLQYFQETTLGSTSLKPSLRLRYVDDTFTLWPQQEDVQTLLDQVNSIRPSIQFSREKEQDNRLFFLDVLINSDGAKIQVICVSKVNLQ